MNKEYKSMLNHGKSLFKEHKRFLNSLKSRKKMDIDRPFQKAHDKVFETINCLECGNCCRELGPKLNRRDIEKISKFLGIKAGSFIKQYLIKDEDDDIIFNQLPCPFLEEDNSCSIYEVRPRACREYPHTNDKNMHSMIGITIKNHSVCPAVPEIVELVKNEIKL